MMDRAYWKKVWLERWLPNIPPAFVAVLASTLLAPMVHEYFVQKENMNNARFAFYTRFINNFGELRGSVGAVRLACIKKPGLGTKDPEWVQLNDVIQQRLEALVYGSFGMKNYFGENSQKKAIEFINWFMKQEFLCKNSKANDLELQRREGELFKLMSPKIFGFNKVI